MMQLEKTPAQAGSRQKSAVRIGAPLTEWGRADWIALAAVAGISLICFLPGLGAYGVIDPSDGLYSEAAREMLEKGDWLTPTANYKPFFEKPILIYWMILSSYKLFGVSEFAARLPVALTGAANAIALYVLTRRFLRRRAALLCAVTLVSLPLFSVIGHLALTDVPLTCFMSVAALALLFAVDRSLRPAQDKQADPGPVSGIQSGLVLAYVALGLVMLIKGPVPIALIGIVLCAYLFLVRAKGSGSWYHWWSRRLSSMSPLIGIAIVVAIALPWYAIETAITHGQFAHEFFIRQNLGRAVGAVNHQNPFWYYIPVFFGGFLPWSVALFFQWKWLKRLVLRRHVLTRRQALALFSLVWMVVIVGLFSLLKTKLATYILPAAPAIAILGGIILDGLARKSRKRAFAFAAVPVVVSAVLVPAGLYYDYCHTHKPLKDLILRAQADNADVALYLRDSPAASFYMKREVTEIRTLLDYKLYVEKKGRAHYLLVSNDVMKQITYMHPSWKLLDRKGKWRLFVID